MLRSALFMSGSVGKFVAGLTSLLTITVWISRGQCSVQMQLTWALQSTF